MILSNFVNITYGVSLQTCSTGFETGIELPDDGAMWTARDETQWLEEHQARASAETTTNVEVLNQIINADRNEAPALETVRRSTFLSNLVLHNLLVYIWHLEQTGRGLSKSLNASLGLNLGEQLTLQAENALSRCNEVLVAGSLADKGERSSVLGISPVFNSACVRLAARTKALDRVSVLGTADGVTLRPQLRTHVKTKQQRNSFTTKAAHWVLKGIQSRAAIGETHVENQDCSVCSMDELSAEWDCCKSPGLVKGCIDIDKLRSTLRRRLDSYSRMRSRHRPS